MDLFETKRTYAPADTPAKSTCPSASGQTVIARDLILEQVLRDLQTLRDGSDWWHPSKTFYEERVKSYQSYLKELENA
jgi:hypothetical protein